MAEQGSDDLITEIGDVLAGMDVPEKAIHAVTDGLGDGDAHVKRPADDDVPSLTTDDDKVGDIDVHTAHVKIDSVDVDLVSLHHGKSDVEIIEVDAGDRHFEVIDIKDGKKEKVFVIDSDDGDGGEDDKAPGDHDHPGRSHDGGGHGGGHGGGGHDSGDHGGGGHGSGRGGEDFGGQEPEIGDQLDDLGGSPPEPGRRGGGGPPPSSGGGASLPPGGGASLPPGGGGAPLPSGGAGQGPPLVPLNAPVQGAPAAMGAPADVPADVPGQPDAGGEPLQQKLVEPKPDQGVAASPPPDDHKQQGDQGNGGPGGHEQDRLADGHDQSPDQGHGGDEGGRPGNGGGGGPGGPGANGEEHVETPAERQRKAAGQGNDNPANGKVTKIDLSYLNSVEAKQKTLADGVHNSEARRLLVGFVGNGTPYSGGKGSSNLPPSGQGGEPPPSSVGGGDTKLLAGNPKWGPAQSFKAAFDTTALDVVNQLNWLYGFLERMSEDIRLQAQNFSETEERNGLTAQDLAGIFSNMPEIGGSAIPGSGDAVGLLQDIILNGQK